MRNYKRVYFMETIKPSHFSHCAIEKQKFVRRAIQYGAVMIHDTPETTTDLKSAFEERGRLFIEFDFKERCDDFNFPSRFLSIANEHEDEKIVFMLKNFEHADPAEAKFAFSSLMEQGWFRDATTICNNKNTLIFGVEGIINKETSPLPKACLNKLAHFEVF